MALLKGCPFRCPWCCNSENLSFAPEVSWKAKLCIGCSLRADGRRDANGCPCDTPSELCPTEAKELLGRMRTSESLAEELLRDRVFFEETGGGVTTNPSILAKSGRAPCEVLAASFKNSQQVLELTRYGVGACTVGAPVIQGLVKNAAIDSAVDVFIADFEGLTGAGTTMATC